MKNAELIARLRVIAGKGMADYFNSGHPNSNAITEAADAIEKLEAEVGRLNMALHGYQVAIETAEESLKDRVALAMEVDRLSAAGVSHCGHRPPCIECSKYAAKQAQPVRPINCGTGHCSCIECPYEQAQPERAPLSDDEIQTIYLRTYNEGFHGRNLEIAFARAIEAAIKQGGKQAQPERAPLSEAQVTVLLDSYYASDFGPDELIRKVEQLHGIEQGGQHD